MEFLHFAGPIHQFAVANLDLAAQKGILASQGVEEYARRVIGGVYGRGYGSRYAVRNGVRYGVRYGRDTDVPSTILAFE